MNKTVRYQSCKFFLSFSEIFLSMKISLYCPSLTDLHVKNFHDSYQRRPEGHLRCMNVHIYTLITPNLSHALRKGTAEDKYVNVLYV